MVEDMPDTPPRNGRDGEFMAPGDGTGFGSVPPIPGHRRNQSEYEYSWHHLLKFSDQHPAAKLVVFRRTIECTSMSLD